MIVYRAEELDIKTGRTHPWTFAGYDESCCYADFRQEPDRIESSLEDFREWEEYPATRRFYDLVRWLNGYDSHFETNDTAFRVGPNNAPTQPYQIEASGRLMLFASDLRLTCAPEFSEWLMGCFHHYLRQIEPPLSAAAVGISKAPCLFKLANAEGHELVLYFWAWGDSNDEVMMSLDRVIERLQMASEKANEEVRNTLDAVSRFTP
jgi:hypothetical protein